MKKASSIILFSLIPISIFAEKSKPNIILIIADDLGYGDLSCYGAKNIKTPAIDSLANNGIKMTDMHACASTSTPSRYAMLTGEYPFRRTGTNVAAGDAASIISADQTTIADLMHRAGYTTAAIGKWHLGLGTTTGKQDWNGVLDFTPQNLGFDYHYIMAATSDRAPCVYIENGQVADYDSTDSIFVSYTRNFDGEPTAKFNPELLTKQKPSHGHDGAIINGISRIGFMKGGGKALWRDEDIADRLVKKAVDFIDSRKNIPFFIYFCTNDIHVPRMPHERFRGKSKMGLRGEAILQFDETVKNITNALRQRGLDKNTLVIITSDNGPVLDDGYADRAIELAGTHSTTGGLSGGKYGALEGGSVVPFILYWPDGIRAGQTIHTLASQIDIPASLSGVAGLPLGEKGFIDSQDNFIQWLGRGNKGREYAVTMAANRSLTLRTQRYKYISPSNGGQTVGWGPTEPTGYHKSPQIFDLQEDPGEHYNIAPDRPKLLQRLTRLLGEIRSNR